ncbi:hypothetical protein F5Y16DRAFT_325018 [Xylariaceae sp. FL0255]|nr:hypothetical protein F5Y16DRAFT_325018 [Xylariaceae sp. FL0255]
MADIRVRYQSDSPEPSNIRISADNPDLDINISSIPLTMADTHQSHDLHLRERIISYSYIYPDRKERVTEKIIDHPCYVRYDTTTSLLLVSSPEEDHWSNYFTVVYNGRMPKVFNSLWRELPRSCISYFEKYWSLHLALGNECKYKTRFYRGYVEVRDRADRVVCKSPVGEGTSVESVAIRFWPDQAPYMKVAPERRPLRPRL